MHQLSYVDRFEVKVELLILDDVVRTSSRYRIDVDYKIVPQQTPTTTTLQYMYTPNLT